MPHSPCPCIDVLTLLAGVLLQPGVARVGEHLGDRLPSCTSSAEASGKAAAALQRACGHSCAWRLRAARGGDACAERRSPAAAAAGNALEGRPAGVSSSSWVGWACVPPRSAFRGRPELWARPARALVGASITYIKLCMHMFVVVDRVV